MDSDHLAPPPAYTEQEFDQKVSQATTLSILTPTPTFDEEGWERYDPSAFERSPVSPSGSVTPSGVGYNPAAFSSSSHTNGSGTQHNHLHQPTTRNHDKSNLINNLPAIVPLRIEKRSQPQYGKLLADQTYPEDKTSLASSQNGKSNAGSSGTVSSFPNGYYGGVIQQHPQQDISNSNSPSASRSPFERTSSYTPHAPVIAPVYQGGEEETYDPYRDYRVPQAYPSSRQSLPAIPQSAPQRPTHGHSRSRSEARNPPAVPRLQFDPSVAYGKPTSTPVTAIQAIHANIPVSPIPTTQYDPHSLYNSTVSSKMVPMRPSQGEVYYQAPSYEQTHYQGQNMAYPLRTGQQPQFVNDTGRNPRHLVVDNSRQPAWQSPSRPTSTYPTSNTPHPVSATDMNRFSQYSTSSSRDSIYSNQTDRYSSR